MYEYIGICMRMYMPAYVCMRALCMMVAVNRSLYDSLCIYMHHVCACMLCEFAYVCMGMCVQMPVMVCAMNMWKKR